MSKMGQRYLELTEIAENGSDDEKIREFGSVAKARMWLSQQSRLTSEAIRSTVLEYVKRQKPQLQPDTHDEWREMNDQP